MKINFLLTENNFYSNDALKIYNKIGKIYNYSKNFKNFNDINVLIVRLSINLNKSFLNKFKNLKFIITPTTGLNHIDLDFCSKNSIKIISLNELRKYIKNVNSTAELTMSLMLSLDRSIVKANNNIKIKREWSRYPYIADSIESKTVGILGMGRIGKKVANYCKLLGFKVIFYDKKKINTSKKYNRVSLNVLLKTADIISIHINFNENNKNFFDSKKINSLKKDCIIINTARGEIIDEYYLLKKIKQFNIRGYACDVIANENIPKLLNNFLKYIKHIDNVIVTPHIGGFTRQSLNYTENLIANHFKKVLINE
jgi:D-3-phosphoglycerate dehydrogenase / 2-oxoglutarate reductase